MCRFRESFGVLVKRRQGTRSQIRDRVRKAFAVAIERATGDEHVGTSSHRACDRGRANAAIDFYIHILAAGVVEHVAHLAHLALHRGDVLLATEARVHRHHKHKVDEVEHVGDGTGRGSRIERYPSRRPKRCDVGQSSMKVRAGLDMHDQSLAAGLHVLFGHPVGGEHHQVRFEWHLRMGTSGGDHVGTESEVWHELTVHDIPLDAVDASCLQCFDLFAEAREVGGQHARCDLDARHLLEGSGVTARRMAGSLSMAEFSNANETVRVEKLVAGGDALAHLADGRVVFVEGALPGETAVVDIRTSKRDFVRGVALSISEPSSLRVEAPCPRLVAGCGGCGWQHALPAAQLQWKTDIVAESLRRIAKLPDPDVRVGPAVEPWNYRTTMRLAVADDATVGLRAAASHRVVAIDGCLVAHPALVAIIPGLRVRGADEITLRVSVATGEVTAFADTAGAQVMGLPESVQVGVQAAIHEVVAGVRLRVSAASFFQSGPQAAELLVAYVREASGDLLVEGGTFLDAYGGVGLFSATLAVPARMGATVVELSESACRDAAINVGTGAQIVCSRMESWTSQPVRLIVADPARSGLAREGVAVLAATGAERIVLVSCDAASLARDSRLLATAGYRHGGSTVLDLFPQTPHVEVVTRFDHL